MAHWNGGVSPEPEEAMVVGEEATAGVAPEEGAAGPAPPPVAAAAQSNGTGPKHGAISSNIHNIMGGMESTAGVKLHNHRRKLRQRFDIVRKLGQGTYGKVQLGINKETGQEVAIKTIKKAKIETEADLIRIRREIQIMSSVRHPNIIHIYEVFENREKMVLVMEYAAGGELYDYLSERKVLAEQEARRIFRQISTAAYYCHKHKICHRDLKLENILLDETGNAKIADFGLSNVFDEQRLLSTFCGSPLYASPEIVKGTPYHGPEVDCWSLGVLLYTLVYGAMPFDGSNFKKLVKQISQGDYFEPKKPSPASPLIRDMLTVTPRKRADIEKICSHWWVNEGYSENCLEVAEHLANQTPVRLDLLLSLAPAPSSDKIVVPETKTEETTPVTGVPPSNFPPRSQSVGSLMELDYPSSRKSSPPRLPIPPPPSVPPPALTAEEATAAAPKRKLQECPSGETGAKRKETKPIESSDTSIKTAVDDNKKKENKNKDESMEIDDQAEKPVKAIKEKRKSIKSKKDSTASKVDKTPTTPTTNINNNNNEEEIKPTVPIKENNIQETPQVNGTADSTAEKTKSIKRKKKVVEATNKSSDTNGVQEDSTSVQSENALIPESVAAINEGQEIPTVVSVVEEKPKDASVPETVEKVEVVKSPSKEVAKKEGTPKLESPVKRRPQSLKNRTKTEELPKLDSSSPDRIVETPPRTDVRRRSSIFEKAEKFNSMSTSNIDTNNKPSSDKPKKIFIPGVKISDFKKAFETKKVPTKSASTSKATEEIKKEVPSSKVKTTKSESPKIEKKEITPKLISPLVPTEKKSSPPEDAQIKKVNEIKAKTPEKIIETPIKSKSPAREKTPKLPSTPKTQSPVPQLVQESDKLIEPKKKSTTMKIVLESSPKSATLPRRTSKAEIRLNNPVPSSPKQPEYRTEVEHMVGTPQPISTQRSEVAFPVSAPAPRQPRAYKHSNTAPTVNAFRSTSLEPDMSRVKERIIPIRLEGDDDNRKRESPPFKPPVHPVSPPKPAPVTRRESRESLSRQSTLDSEPETIRGEPIRKSPREFIIPIAVEGGGYVTPRATSLEPSTDSVPSTPTRPRAPRLVRPIGSRMGLLSESEDGIEQSPPVMNGVAPPPPFNRLSSMTSDHGDDDSQAGGAGTLGRGLHMHRLRSSRPTRQSVEHNDSFSSGEEDDEDDGFEILTAESLFSTLLSRMCAGQVRSLTQRLNVEDTMRPGFSSSRLLGHMPPFSTQPHHSLFSNFHGRMGEPLTRRLSDHSRLSRTGSRGEEHASPWRRSVSRDASDGGDSVYSEHHPRGEVGGSAIDYTSGMPHHHHHQARRSQYQEHRHHNDPQSYRRTISADMSHQEPYRSYQRQYTENDINYRQQPQQSQQQPNYYRPDQDVITDHRSANLYGTIRQPSRTQSLNSNSRNRSISLNRENSWKKNQRITPERSVLGKFLAQDLRELSPTTNPPPPPPPLTHEERRRGRRVSRFLRPDFFDTPREESVYVRQKEDEERLRRDRKSVERRSQLDDGHVNRAINSLHQRNNSQDFTESTLIKRAVSSDDCAQYEQPPRGKVNSVLGMFKKMENQPDKNAISRFRRAQSVYDASSSDSSIQNEILRSKKPTSKETQQQQRQSAFLPYGQRTPSEEKSLEDGDYDDEYSQASRRHDSSSANGQDDSFDSWSVCSDNLEPLEDETVSDRIRRKSFYTRFNDYVAPKKPQSNKASPAVAAILERDIPRSNKPHKHHHHHRDSSERRHHSRSRHPEENGGTAPVNGAAVDTTRNRRSYNYGSLPRGWEPQAEAEYYQQARKMNRYAQQQHPSAPLFPTPQTRRPGRSHSPPLGVDH